MQTTSSEKILRMVAQGALPVEKALAALRAGVVHDTLTGVRLDTQRAFRTGMAEVVFAQGKSEKALLASVGRLADCGPVLASRVSPEQAGFLQKAFPQGLYFEDARLFAVNAGEGFARALTPPFPESGDALVFSAGAVDMPVALEAYATLAFNGISCGCVTDVGIAGLHRLAPHARALQEAQVVIAVAGLEGALPGVLAGITPAPVLAVPVSAGYGMALGGFSALSTMLCTCVPGVAVLNVDNGFGAAAFAVKMLRQKKP
ncbi:MAG: nickel pincer cofactor biosynthesis protein LarB [Desulfovibrio sp.]|nr:nickel pincer cofactor biosynthesis protein LarB [Desulfovibrio sp.]